MNMRLPQCSALAGVCLAMPRRSERGERRPTRPRRWQRPVQRPLLPRSESLMRCKSGRACSAYRHFAQKRWWATRRVTACTNCSVLGVFRPRQTTVPFHPPISITHVHGRRPMQEAKRRENIPPLYTRHQTPKNPSPPTPSPRPAKPSPRHSSNRPTETSHS